MLTLKNVTGHERGVVIWEDGKIFPVDWRSMPGLPSLGVAGLTEDFLSKAHKLTERDLTEDQRKKLLDEGKGANIDGIWRIGKAIVVTFKGWP